MSDQIHRDAILNPNAVEMGVGYAYVAATAHTMANAMTGPIRFVLAKK